MANENIATPALVQNVGSFMRLPAATDLKQGPDIGIVGIPFDCGQHPERIGSRDGPAAIRKQSLLLRKYDITHPASQPNPFDALQIADFGDADCRSGDIDYSYPRIQQAIEQVLATGAIPLTMGGDGAVTLPQLRALASRYADLVVLHIDAHTDAYDLDGYDNATTFTRAAEESLIDTERSFHIGTRGTTFTTSVISYGESLGYNVVLGKRLASEGPSRLIDEVKKKIGDRPVYLCFDMDIFDPSCAPGVCTPEWGGLNPQQGLELLEQLMGLNFVAFDVNTVSPPHDSGGMTAFLAATVMWKCCFLAMRSAQ